MRRLPAVAFAVLAAATVYAFFLTQNLKTRNTVVGGNPKPLPAAFNPVSGNRDCPYRTDQHLNYRRTVLTLRPPQAGTVAVSVINRFGTTVATVSSGRLLRRDQPSRFVWNGRESDGQIAPDGTYYFQVSLVQQARTINLPTPITLRTHPPHPEVTRVALTLAAGAAKAAKTGEPGKAGGGHGKRAGGVRTTGPVVLTPPDGSITVHFPPHDYRRVWIDVYRTDLAGRPRRVIKFRVKDPALGTAVWDDNAANGTLVPAGTYLVGITAQDQACNQANYPVTMPPAPGSTPHTGVTVRYLAATPPLVPTAAGSRASVAVDSPTGPYTWKLRLAGGRKALRHGSGVSGSSTLRVWLPAKQGAGLYTLTLNAGPYSTSVPLVAAATSARAARARVLVVLPILTWQGEDPVDDTGDGLPSTLSAGQEVDLSRPLAHGPPAGLGQDAALLSFLRQQHMSYQLTTDVALAQGAGPSLLGRWGVVLAGSETWLPASLAQTLEDFVERRGGRVLSIGTDALRGTAAIRGYPSDPVAAAPVNTRTDLFGAQHGPLTSTDGDLITELTDQLDIFNAAPAFSGFDAYTPIEPPAGATVSLAGVANSAPAVAAFTAGKGYVVEIGLADFNTSLAGNVDAQELLSRIWQLLAK